MSKLAVTTLGCPDWDFETIVLNAKEMGYDAIELRGIKDVMRIEDLPIFAPDNLAKTKALLADNELCFCNAGTSVMFHDPANRDAAMSEGKAAIDTCYRVGIPAIRVFGDAIPPGDTLEVVAARIADGIKELCKYSREKTNGAVQIWLEVHGDFNTIKAIELITEKLTDCPEFGVLWDVQHTYRSSTDPLNFYQQFKPIIRHIHFKDCDVENGVAIIKVPGEGTLKLKEHYDIIEDGGYNGYYSFEYEKRWYPDLPGPEIAFPKFVELMRSFAKS